MQSTQTLELRAYQQECVDEVLKANTIVVLPTGTGKTLVATRCIDRLRLKAREERSPGQDRVMFIAPTVDLVDQQADYCEKHCSPGSRVIRLSSSEKMGWTKRQWEEGLVDYEILVGTPEIFSRALTKYAYINLRPFCFLIFDECHHAKGNAPMVGICKDALLPYMDTDAAMLRVAGFTASPCTEGMKQSDEAVESTTFMLQRTLQAKIFAPNVPPEFCGVSAKDGSYEHVDVPPEHDAVGECGCIVETWLEELLSKLNETGKMKDVTRVVRRLRHVFDQVGKDGFRYAIAHNVIPQLQAKIVQLMAYTQDAPERRQEAELLQSKLPDLKKKISDEAESLEAYASEKSATWKSLPKHSSKTQALIKLLKKVVVDKCTRDDSDFRCLVLVHETMIPRPLAHIINEDIKTESRSVLVGSVGGTNSMSSEERRRAIEHFRCGDTPILVATPALEEGLDVPQCQVVVRFDKFTTTKSHIQGSGRARHADAKVYYFENDPTRAQRAAKRMISTAKSSEIKPQDDDFEHLREEHKRARLNGKHPFGGSDDGAEISVFNCRDVVYAYGAKVLKDTFVKEALYEWTQPPDAQLLKVTYPSPDGFKTISKEDIDAYWSGVDMSSVFDPERCKRYGNRDRQELKFLFLVARRLRESGYLDKHNQPTVRAREMTMKRCPQSKRQETVTISNKFPKVSSCQGVSNPKGILQEWCQRSWRSIPMDQLLKYETIEVPGGFKSILQVLKLKLRFEGDAKPSKKLAEHGVAQKALEDPNIG